MSSEILSTNVEPKKNRNVYHFGYRDNHADRSNFTQKETQTFALVRLFDNNFSGTSKEVRDSVISIIVNELDVEHKNLLCLISATYFLYMLKSGGNQLTPQSFQGSYSYFKQVLEKNIPERKSKDRLISARFQTDFYRYIAYVQLNSKEFNQRI